MSIGSVRVLHIIPSFAGGGAERQLAHLSRAQVKLGLDVHLAHMHGGPNLEVAKNSGAQLHQLSVRHNYDPRSISQIREIIRMHSITVCQSWLLHADITTALATFIEGCAWVLSERSSGDNYRGNFKFALRQNLGRRADLIVANSNSGARYWRDAGYRKQIVVVPNIVDVEERIECPLAKDAVGRDRKILAIGRLSEEKNYSDLLRALELVLPQLNGYQVDILGDGHLRPLLQRQIDHSELLRGRVNLLGFVDDVSDRLKRASLFISYSRFEGSPNGPIEAMRSSCPMVLSDIESHRELVDGTMTRFASLSSIQDLADAVVQSLLDVEGSARRVERAGRKLKAESWRASTIAETYIGLYEAVSRGRT